MNISPKTQKLLPSSLLFSFLFSSFTIHAGTSRDQEIESYLKNFAAHTREAMDAPLHKQVLLNGKPTTQTIPSLFSSEDIQNGSFVEKKDALRKHLKLSTKSGRTYRLEQLRPGRAGIEEGDLPAELIDVDESDMLMTLEDMQKAKLLSAHLKHNPWSDSYWPIYQGEIAARYADRSFDRASYNEEWNKFYDYVQEAGRSYQDILISLNSGQGTTYPLEKLSPAEKYDLLVGDGDGTLTDYMWRDGEGYARSNNGIVERWMGLCHGWAAAAIMEKRPTNLITVTAADGHTEIPFYPSDIKALATSLWANGDFSSRGMGGRCHQKDPKKDSNGRIIDQSCFDTNPGAWHLAIVNQIGVAKRSVVMDATFDYEVWNHPIFSYSYSYFNPETNESVRHLKDAKIPLSKFKNDKFKKYRSADAAYVVGIAMDVEYVIETQPTHSKTDGENDDLTTSVRYIYDLELDRNGEIIGGEWYSNKHPDFLWVHPKNESGMTYADRYAQGTWNANQEAFPSAWKKPAIRSSNNGLPLTKVIRALIEASRER